MFVDCVFKDPAVVDIVVSRLEAVEVVTEWLDAGILL